MEPVESLKHVEYLNSANEWKNSERIQMEHFLSAPINLSANKVRRAFRSITYVIISSMEIVCFVLLVCIKKNTLACVESIASQLFISIEKLCCFDRDYIYRLGVSKLCDAKVWMKLTTCVWVCAVLLGVDIFISQMRQWNTKKKEAIHKPATGI